MNLIANSIDALDETIQSCELHSANDAMEQAEVPIAANPPCVTIQTELTAAKQVMIRLGGNGIGITETVLSTASSQTSLSGHLTSRVSV